MTVKYCSSCYSNTVHPREVFSCKHHVCHDDDDDGGDVQGLSVYWTSVVCSPTEGGSRGTAHQLGPPGSLLSRRQVLQTPSDREEALRIIAHPAAPTCPVNRNQWTLCHWGGGYGGYVCVCVCARVREGGTDDELLFMCPDRRNNKRKQFLLTLETLEHLSAWTES